MNSKVSFPFHLRFQSWHVQIIYVGEINAKIIQKDLVNTLKIWVHFQFLLYATIVLKINDLGYSSFFSPMYMNIVWCKIRVFFYVSLYKHGGLQFLMFNKTHVRLFQTFSLFQLFAPVFFGDFGVLLANKFSLKKWNKHWFFKRQVCISVALL